MGWGLFKFMGMCVCVRTCLCVYMHDLTVYQVCSHCGAPATSLGFRDGSSFAGRLSGGAGMLAP